MQNLAESIEGEKTYFSNGVIESVKGKLEDTEAEASFNPNGEVIEINIGSEKYDLGFQVTGTHKKGREKWKNQK